MDEFDFFETPVIPYSILSPGAEVRLHVRNTETMEQTAIRGVVARSIEALPNGSGARLNCYGRLGARISDEWFIHVLEELEDEALSTDHIKAQSLDIEQSLKSPEQFKKSRFREDKET